MADLVVLFVRFRTKPGKKEEFRVHIQRLVETMKVEPAFVNSILHDDLDNPNDLVLYETWRGTKESWLREEWMKPYRAPYEKLVPEMLEERTVGWMTPIQCWPKI